MALTALYNLSFTPGLEIGSDEKALDDKDQLVPGNYDFFRENARINFQVLENGICIRVSYIFVNES